MIAANATCRKAEVTEANKKKKKRNNNNKGLNTKKGKKKGKQSLTTTTITVIPKAIFNNTNSGYCDSCNVHVCGPARVVGVVCVVVKKKKKRK